MRKTTLALTLVYLACSTPGTSYTAEHWQRLDDVPGRVADPYAASCTLIEEEPRVFGPIGAREFWMKRTYLCDA